MTKYLLDKLEIEPAFNVEAIDSESFSLYLDSTKKLIQKILGNPQENTEDFLYSMQKSLPIIHYSKLSSAPSCFAFSMISPKEYFHGVGRFIADMLSKWLIPGKQLVILSNRSLIFRFSKYNKHHYYLTEYHIHIPSQKDLEIIQKNLKKFTKTLKINILAVYQARHIVSTKNLTFEEKSAIIQENLSILLNRKKMDIEKNAFDQMQHFMFKLSAENNLSKIKENIHQIMNKNKKFLSMDRNIFEEIYNISLLFYDSFTAIRNPKYLSKIIGLFYLFQKMISQKTYRAPNIRHLSFKILKPVYIHKFSAKASLVLSLNLTQETERFDKKHLLKAISSCISNIQYVPHSFIEDKKDMIRSFYIEIEKKDKKSFAIEELKNLRKKLPKEIKEGIENFVNPIFMPRNEEETIRNIILLSKQLKYVNDLPQVIISYDKQNNKEIIFTVILVRLLRNESLPLKEYFLYSKTVLKFIPEEIKIVGYLKRKYSKECNIFRISLNKTPFFRKDFSLDLQKARQFVVSELVKILGNFRDFNGGMMIQQKEAFDSLKQLLPNVPESSIEKFFYSLKPGVMQSILDPKLLKMFYKLFEKTLNNKNLKNNFFIKSILHDKYLFIMIGATFDDFIEQIKASILPLQIPSSNLTSCVLKESDITAFGYIFRNTNFLKQACFYHNILKTLNQWKKP